MKVSDILARSEGTRFSLEVYPPKVARTPSGPSLPQSFSDILETVEHLLDFEPAFVSVTFNPEGKNKATSIPLAAIIKQRYRVEAVSHLTCIATPKKELRRTLDVLSYFDIENIMALRGDRPKDMPPERAGPEHACELVTEIVHHEDKFCIGVAAHPEGHPECVDNTCKRDLDRDLRNFKEKVDQGASFAITQLFLDNKVYFDFVDRARKAGMTIPIIPGIMPVINFDVVKIVKGLAGATVPPALERKLEAHKDEPQEIWQIGIEHAIHQCRGLMDKVPDIHFYTMDLWKPTKAIIDGLK
jgi:methylenetetrahydrofolate reductase (NADPH)